MQNNNENFSNNEISGNKFSLRSRALDLIKKWGFVSNRLGPLGDMLISTWASTIIAFTILMAGAVLILILATNHLPIILQNIVPLILLGVGIFGIALQFLLINPSEGFQIIVSYKYLKHKFDSFVDSRGYKKVRPFTFIPENPEKDIIKMVDKNVYIAGYSVVGVYSPTSFTSDLKEYAKLDATLLTNIERDTTIITDISINKVVPEKLELPDNATQAMLIARNLRYQKSSSNLNNKNIKTNIYVSSPSLEVLQKRRARLEMQFRQGLVLGYQQLHKNDLKKAIKSIYF